MTTASLFQRDYEHTHRLIRRPFYDHVRTLQGHVAVAQVVRWANIVGYRLSVPILWLPIHASIESQYEYLGPRLRTRRDKMTMKYTDIPYFFVFDVESVGLHGEAFAVGYAVVDREGKEEDAAMLATPFKTCKGTLGDFDWIEKHCDNLPTNIRAADLRCHFWESCWMPWKIRGAVMAADVNWPVESKFLSECVNADHETRAWNGPYPLIDVASVLLAKGYDPAATYRRLERELPEHNPLADARQSARLLTMALRDECLKFS